MPAAEVKIQYMNRNPCHQAPELVLAIESSCDETAASVVRHGSEVLSNVVASQVEVHCEYGGVVPEIASRCHMEIITRVVDQALGDARLGLGDVSALAVTQGPGLVGSLVVGLSFAKALSAAAGLPLTGVNHVHAHLFSPFLSSPVAPVFPSVGLVVSGGHTSLFLVEDYLSIKALGRTRDDAAGEAFDKVAKLLGLGYPGGPAISEAARDGDPAAFALPRAWLRDSPYDFSFSGLKTAVLNLTRALSSKGRELPVQDLCASFQEAVVEVLVKKTVQAATDHRTRHVVLSGGVAANERLRECLLEEATAQGLELHLPSHEYCTDNGAMVGLVGYHQLRHGMYLGLDADAYSRMP